MKLIRLVFLRIKQTLKSPSTLVMLVILPVFMAGFMAVSTVDKMTETYTNVAIRLEEGDLKDALKGDYGKFFTEDSLDEITRRLSDRKVVAYYEFPHNFLEAYEGKQNPKVKVYSLDGKQKDVVFEAQVENTLKKIVLGEKLYGEGLIDNPKVDFQGESRVRLDYAGVEADGGTMLIFFMLIFFILMNGSIVSADLVDLKKNNVLKRLVGTSNSSYFIMGSLIGAYLVFMIGFNLLAAVVLSGIFGYSLQQFPVFAANIAAISFVSVSLALLLFRLLDQPETCLIVGYILALGLAALGFLPTYFETNLLLEKVSYFSPVYWIMESLDKNSFFPQVPIVILMGLVLFTAGSHKLENYVNK